MVNLVRIYPWNPKSESAKQLAGAMGVKRLKHAGSTLRHGKDRTIINWGASAFADPLTFNSKVINNPDNVDAVSNKLKFFQLLEGKVDCIPEFTSDKQVALQWLEGKSVVFARKVLKGSGGNGIVIMYPDNPKTWVDAPLYTKYIKKKEEYRVHVMGGKIFLVQRKGLRKVEGLDPSKVNWAIRNLENGFIFVRNDVAAPDVVLKASTDIFPHLGLDFYAADVVYNAQANLAYVLEVNTAPGLDGSTINDYAQAFKSYLGGVT